MRPGVRNDRTRPPPAATQNATHLCGLIVPPTVELAAVSLMLAHEAHRELACTRSESSRE